MEKCFCPHLPSIPRGAPVAGGLLWPTNNYPAVILEFVRDAVLRTCLAIMSWPSVGAEHPSLVNR